MTTIEIQSMRLQTKHFMMSYMRIKVNTNIGNIVEVEIDNVRR